MEKLLRYQYEGLKDSRNVLLDYCQTFQKDDLLKEFENFGRGSIRNLLVHIVNTYEFWLGNFAQKKNLSFTKPKTLFEVNEIRKIYEKTDDMVFDYLKVFSNNFEIPIIGTVRAREIKATPLKLFTHVLTHEFHHKGQILSMSRHLGYTPPDTDIVR